MNALVPTNNADAYRASTDAAELCKGIVVATAMEIQRRKYVKVEGWQAIAIAHGCTCSARDVEKVEGGVRAVGEVRRMSDGVVIAEAEGFVGEDETTWYGGKDKWGKDQPKRADYAIRAMAQTRAISRACRSAFAHVVVMMNAGLQTTPAEEVPQGGFDNGDVIDHAPQPPKAASEPPKGRTVNPMSAHQAKKDGRGERAAKLANEIADLQEVTECLAWKMLHVDEVGTWPKPWQDELWGRWDIQIEGLRELAAKLNPPTEDAEAEVMFPEAGDDRVARYARELAAD